MPKPSSKSSTDRQTGKHQVDEQRASILEAAEKLFLQNGLEKTGMVDIAHQAGITRVTLYRYFANRDEIAVAVHLGLMRKTGQLLHFDRQDQSLEGHKKRVLAMIRNFDLLRDLYRYTGMFDRIYLDDTPDATLTRWTLDQFIMAGFGQRAASDRSQEVVYSEELAVIRNTVVWFLEKLALRGELTWSNKDVPLTEHLRIFEEMIMGYFDRLIEKAGRPGDDHA